MQLAKTMFDAYSGHTLIGMIETWKKILQKRILPHVHDSYVQSVEKRIYI